MEKIAIVLLLAAILCPVSALAWDGKLNNKSLDELTRLPDHDLPNEALGPCIYTAFWNGQNKEFSVLPALYKARIIKRKKEAMIYLSTIKQVAQKRNQGQISRWAESMLKAASGNDSRHCAAAWKTVLEEQIRNPAESTK